MQTLAIFRSCLRKEYRDQVIKMLRAVPGEFTRTSFRSQWIDPELLSIAKSGEQVRALSLVVDPTLTKALPCRFMRLLEEPIYDANIDVYRFVFELEDYISLDPGFNSVIPEWEVEDTSRPPHRFVSVLNNDWIHLDTVPYSESSGTWKRNITFLTESWPNFRNTVFFRPHGDGFHADPSGPLNLAHQSEVLRLNFESFNPHLEDDELRRKTINVSVGDLMADLSPVDAIPRDGNFYLGIRFLEPGTANVRIEVRPDEQFSTYVPLRVEVEGDQTVDPSGPRILGPDWTNFLAKLWSDFDENRTLHIQIIDRLIEVFPGDPELLIQRGRLHYLVGEHAAARDNFLKALSQRTDPRAIWWNMFAALRSDDIGACPSLLEQLDFSRLELFEEAVAIMPTLTDNAIIGFAEYPAIAMGEDKALRLLLAMLMTERSESAVLSVVEALYAINQDVCFQVAGNMLSDHREWVNLRRLVIALALKAGRVGGFEDDATQLLEFGGGHIDEYLSTVHSLRPFIHPQRFPGLLLSNARLIANRGDSDMRRAAVALGVVAANDAAANGDFITAQHALQFVEINGRREPSEWESTKAQVSVITDRISRVLCETPAIHAIDELYVAELVEELKSYYSGRSVLIFGGQKIGSISDLGEQLGLRQFVWLADNSNSAADANQILTHISDDLSLLVLWQSDPLITSKVWDQVTSARIPVARVVPSAFSILEALRQLTPTAQESRRFIPTSCLEAFQWSVVQYSNLEFSPGISKSVEELDAQPNWSTYAHRIISDLGLLDRYTVERMNNRVSIGFKDWAALNGLPSKQFAAGESESTDSNPRLRQQRTFSVGRDADPSGKIEMPWHFKFPKVNSVAPRLYFTIETIPIIGKTYVGYIGHHLATMGSN